MDDDDPNGIEKRDPLQAFPEDIFRASGENAQRLEDSRSSIECSDYGTHPALHRSENPFETVGDEPLLWKDSSSVSSASSSASCSNLFQVDHSDHSQRQPPQDFNPRQTPATQAMDRSQAHDTSRIPASVFTPNSPMDWSVASNESLFSLHVGNNSFSRDQFLMMGLDFRKSGELFKPDELHKSGELCKSSDLFSLSLTTPPVVPPAAETKTEPSHKEDQPPTLPVSTSTISSHSDESRVSGASARSFAFPALTEAKRESTEKEEPVNLPEKQASKPSRRRSLTEQISSKMPSCSLCCCYCSCSCLSWRPWCWRWYWCGS